MDRIFKRTVNVEETMGVKIQKWKKIERMQIWLEL